MTRTDPQAAVDALERELAREPGPWNLGYFRSHRLRYQADLEAIRAHYRDGQVLEVGAFPFHLTYLLKATGYPVAAVDLEPRRVAGFIDRHGLPVVGCDVEQEPLPYADGAFSLVLCLETFEHLRIDPIFALAEINRVLAFHGRLLLTTPNFYSVRNIVSLLAGRGVDFGGAYQEFAKLYTVGHMGHVREYTAAELRRFLEASGMEVVGHRYRWYPKTERTGLRGRALRVLLAAAYRLVPWWRPYQEAVGRKIGPPRLGSRAPAAPDGPGEPPGGSPGTGPGPGRDRQVRELLERALRLLEREERG